MRYLPINYNLFKNNRKKFISQMKKNSLAVFFSNDQYPRNGDQYFSFRQQSDFFYLTGIEQEKSILLLSPDCPNKNLREAIFILHSNPILETWEGHKYNFEEVQEISGIKNIYWLEDFDVFLKEAMSYQNNVYLNSNEYPKFNPEVVTREMRFGQEIKNNFPFHKYYRAAPLLTKQRLVKSSEEIDLIRHACNITNKALRKVLSVTRPGLWEFELEAEITHEFIKNRANGHSYAPIIASGKNACVLHYIENNKKLKKGDLILMDFGAEYANYAADLTRTIPVNGKFNNRQRELYSAVLSVMKEVKKLYIPGSTINDINDAANKLMEQQLVKLGLLTKQEIKKQDLSNPAYKKYFMHGTAHFLGLDVHDVGSKYETLKPGMILTCEPGLYIKEENIGIRIENDILITENEPEDLMSDFPIEIEEIESLMNE